MMTKMARAGALLALLLSKISVAQQAPFYNTPKFDRSVSHRNNFCQQHRLVFNESIDVKDALRDLELSVVLGNSGENRFALDANGKIPDFGYPGLYVVLLDELARRAGFTWRDSFGVVPTLNASTDGNKTWTDYLEWRVDTFDLSPSRWSRSFSRMNRGISFPEGWEDASIILVERESSSGRSSTFDIWNFLLPFDTIVWILIAISIIVTGLLYWGLDRLDSDADARNLDDEPCGAIFLSALTFTQHFEFRPNSSAARIIAFSWAFWALITAAAYTANLASFLVARNTPNVKVASLDQAERWNIPICVRRSVNVDQYITDKHPKANLIRFETDKDVYDGLLNGVCDVLADEKSVFDMFKRRSDVNSACDLKWHGRTEKIVSGGFATAMDTGTYCTSLVSNVLDLYLIEMNTDGFIESAWEDYLEVATDHQCQVPDARQDGDSNDGSVGLNIHDMGGIFVFHYILCTIAFMLAFLGYCRRKRLIKRSAKLKDDGDNSQESIDQLDNIESMTPSDPSIKRRSPAARNGRRSIWDSSPRDVPSKILCQSLSSS